MSNHERTVKAKELSESDSAATSESIVEESAQLEEDTQDAKDAKQAETAIIPDESVLVDASEQKSKEESASPATSAQKSSEIEEATSEQQTALNTDENVNENDNKNEEEEEALSLSGLQLHNPLQESEEQPLNEEELESSLADSSPVVAETEDEDDASNTEEESEVVQEEESESESLQSVSSNSDSSSSSSLGEHAPVPKVETIAPTDRIVNALVRISVSGYEFDWMRPHAEDRPQESTGSGFVVEIDQQATTYVFKIITAYHVVRNARTILTEFAALSSNKYRAHVLSACPDIDTAVLSVSIDITDKTSERQKQKLSDVRELELAKPYYNESGDLVADTNNTPKLLPNTWVWVIGYPLGKETPKMTRGIISGRDEVYLQIDNPVNPGNSGGPLVLFEKDGVYSDDSQGNPVAVGIIAAREFWAEGMGYAIPMQTITVRRTRLLNPSADATRNGPALESVGALNLSIGRTNESLIHSIGSREPGALVRYVVPGSALSVTDHNGDQTLIERGDLLVRVNGHSVDYSGDVEVKSWWPDRVSISALLAHLSPDIKVSVEVWKPTSPVKCNEPENDNVFANGKNGNIQAENGGETRSLHAQLDTDKFVLREYYEDLEPPRYVDAFGVIVMTLALNHFGGHETVDRVRKASHAGYAAIEKCSRRGRIRRNLVRNFGYLLDRPSKRVKPVLIVTHIMPDSPLAGSDTLGIGDRIVCVNNQIVNTLDEYAKAVIQATKDDGYVRWQTIDRMVTVLAKDDLARVRVPHNTASVSHVATRSFWRTNVDATTEESEALNEPNDDVKENVTDSKADATSNANKESNEDRNLSEDEENEQTDSTSDALRAIRKRHKMLTMKKRKNDNDPKDAKGETKKIVSNIPPLTTTDALLHHF